MRAKGASEMQQRSAASSHGSRPWAAPAKKNAARRPRFWLQLDRRNYCAPIFTSVTSKISVSFGGKPFFGSEP